MIGGDRIRVVGSTLADGSREEVWPFGDWVACLGDGPD
jgi:hypothetical protein